MTGGIIASGRDPVWALWAEWAAGAGVAFTVGGGADGASVPAGSIVLASAWDAPPREAVAAARIACGQSGDVWLAFGDPWPELQVEVLAAGGAGCVPRLPDAAAVRRALRLAAWRPHAPAVPPPPTWWAWPAPGAGGPAVLAPWPVPAEYAAAALRGWRRARGPGGWLGVLPEGPGAHPVVRRAAASAAAAVTVLPDAAAVAAARRAVAALRLAGRADLRAWLVGPGTPGDLAQVLGTTCDAVPEPDLGWAGGAAPWAPGGG